MESQPEVVGNYLDAGHTLVVKRTNDDGLKKNFEKDLFQIDGLKLIMMGCLGGSDTTYFVSFNRPLSLIDLLKQMQHVENVTKKGSKLVISLKTKK